MSYVTVKELREMLKNEDENAIIVLSRDSEGNDFSPLCESYGYDNYLPEEDCNNGVIYPIELSDNLIANGWTEEDLGEPEERDRMIRCITLYPLL